MAEPFIGQLMLVPYNFVPRGWAACDGSLLSIAQNSALFSLLGTTYGGNGTTTFALPDLRGRAPVSQGQGPGLQPYTLGETGGAESVTLLAAQMPAHNHLVHAQTGDANDGSPQNALPAGQGSYQTGAPNATMNSGMIAPAGGSQPHENRPPFLALQWIIALQGIFPSRS